MLHPRTTLTTSSRARMTERDWQRIAGILDNESGYTNGKYWEFIAGMAYTEWITDYTPATGSRPADWKEQFFKEPIKDLDVDEEGAIWWLYAYMEDGDLDAKNELITIFSEAATR